LRDVVIVARWVLDQLPCLGLADLVCGAGGERQFAAPLGGKLMAPASNSLLRRPFSACTNTSTAAPSSSARSLSVIVLELSDATASKGMSTATAGSSHCGRTGFVKIVRARAISSPVKTGESGSQTSVATRVISSVGLAEVIRDGLRVRVIDRRVVDLDHLRDLGLPERFAAIRRLRVDIINRVAR
jgi:hypothetical protein